MQFKQTLKVGDTKYTLEEVEENVIEIIDAIDQNTHLFDDASSEYGTMGLAIFYFYCHQYFKDEKYLEKGEQLINQSIIWISSISQNNFELKYRGDSLSNVISSFGKGLLFLQYHWNYDYDFEDYYTLIDDALEEVTEQNLKEKDFDYFSGALSAGYYHLNKYYYQKDDKSKIALQKIYSAIQEHAIYNNSEEIYWRASTTYNNLIYLGVSHGCSMIINFISKLFHLEVLENNNLNQDFLQKAIRFVISQKVDGTVNFFPDFYFNDEETKYEMKTIFGITYGDLGVLYALFNANKILKDPFLEEQITAMLLATTQRKMDIKFTYDAGIMYGASGLFSTFKELYNTTNEGLYKQCYKYWYDQIMEQKNQNLQTKAGYTFVCTPKDFITSISDEFSLGWGLAGVGIHLLIGIDSKLPSAEELTLLGKSVLNSN